jgi:AraC-like DNA-binding protein
MSLFYSLLAYLVGQEKEERGNRHGDVIAPAVEYLKKHIYDPTLKIEKLHRLCGVSDTYFRKLFILKYGISPKNYVASKRLDHAKAMITSGDYNSVGEVALAVGFNDPLYFSKAFKRKYGISPTEAVI